MYIYAKIANTLSLMGKPKTGIIVNCFATAVCMYVHAYTCSVDYLIVIANYEFFTGTYICTYPNALLIIDLFKASDLTSPDFLPQSLVVL